MKKILIVITLAITFIPRVSAQKKELDKVRNSLKTGKELDKAEQTMYRLLADSTGRQNEKLWLMLYDVVRKQYDAGNERLYLKQSYDTAAIFSLTQRMFRALEGLDSVELVHVGGVVDKLKYRRRHAETLHLYRQNLYNGGMYHLRRKEYEAAYTFLDHYLSCAHLPLFAGYDYATTDPLMPVAAYWSVYCGYKLQRPPLALRHLSLAVKDAAHYEQLLQYLSEIYQMEDNTARYLEILRIGFETYPGEQFFYSRLIEFYSRQKDWATANALIDQARQKQRSDLWLSVAKTTALLNLEQYEACIAVCDSVIAQNATLPEAWLNAGLSYFNQAVEMGKDVKQSRAKRKQIQTLYQHALPYLEKFRTLAPAQTALWAMPLYTIYLNLNMGKEFEEMDRLMRTIPQ
jgi:tetratricopeptide repeat protein